jgi:ABC-2 type transport system ATP-binding protein
MQPFRPYIALRGVAPIGYVGIDAGVLAWNHKVTVSDSGTEDLASTPLLAPSVGIAMSAHPSTLPRRSSVSSRAALTSPQELLTTVAGPQRERPLQTSPHTRNQGSPMITIERLTKKYGSTLAVDHVSFNAAPGRVTGFLGPNGAGKSTTLRIMVGLTRPDSGSATISGRHYVDLPNPGREVGVLLDASAQHAGRTGREILTLAQQFMGLPRTRVEEMLEVVSLTPAEASRRVGEYSLGMRQRLGIAAALIGDPEVLILDEPANGLDPAGIRWMRDLLRGYADRGGAVLLSSHLLHEIEVIADDIVMIGLGRIVSMGTKTELLHQAGTVVRAADLLALELAVTAGGLSATHLDRGALCIDADAALVGKVAFDAGIALTELRPATSAGLEEMFLELTAATQREGAPA